MCAGEFVKECSSNKISRREKAAAGERRERWVGLQSQTKALADSTQSIGDNRALQSGARVDPALGTLTLNCPGM